MNYCFVYSGVCSNNESNDGPDSEEAATLQNENMKMTQKRPGTCLNDSSCNTKQSPGYVTGKVGSSTSNINF